MKAITRAVDEALDEWYAKGYNDGLEVACNTDNRTLCKCVSEDIKERIEYCERKDRENQEEQDKAEDVSEEEIVKNISKEEAKKLMWDEVRDLGYKEGLERAWELAKFIALSEVHGGASTADADIIFGRNWYDIFRYMTIYDVLELFERNHEKAEIHVGDEVKVISTNISGVVTKVIDDCVLGICVDGSMFSGQKGRIEKTGNHFAEVSKLLEALRGDEAV